MKSTSRVVLNYKWLLDLKGWIITSGMTHNLARSFTVHIYWISLDGAAMRDTQGKRSCWIKVIYNPFCSVKHCVISGRFPIQVK